MSASQQIATMSPLPVFPSVAFDGFALACGGIDDVVSYVLDGLDAGAGGSVLSINLDILRRAHYIEQTRGELSRAELLLPDGMPLVWAARLAGHSEVQRLAGSTLVPALTDAGCERSLRLMYLGANPGIAEQVAQEVRHRHPDPSRVTSYFPQFGFEKDAAQTAELEDAMRAAAPDIVFVALPSGKQEALIERLRSEHPGTWFVACGVTLSFMAGQVKRAPVWVQNIGLEWAHRFVQEPRRLFRRYFLEDIPFLPKLLSLALKERRAAL